VGDLASKKELKEEADSLKQQVKSERSAAASDMYFFGKKDKV
jgi:hypothetical protein